MFDTLILSIDTPLVAKLEMLPSVEKAGGRVWSLKNIQIRYLFGRVFLSGSIAKYWNGENVHALNNIDYRQALDAIGRALEVDLHFATVIRFDVGFCFFSDFQILESFGFSTLSAFNRIETRNGKTRAIESVLYKAFSSELEIYDKSKESDKEKGLFRVEYRILKRQAVKRFFGCDVNPYELAYKDNIEKIKNRMKRVYASIEATRYKALYCNCNNGKLTTKTTKDALAIMALQENKRLERLSAILDKSTLQKLKTLKKSIKPPFYLIPIGRAGVDKAFNMFLFGGC